VGSRLKLRDAIEAAQKADVVTYVLLISDPQYPSNYGDMTSCQSKPAAGSLWSNHPDKLDKAFAEIAAELRSQYSLGTARRTLVMTGAIADSKSNLRTAIKFRRAKDITLPRKPQQPSKNTCYWRGT